MKNSDLSLIMLLAVTMIASGSTVATVLIFMQQTVEAIRDPIFFGHPTKAPIAISGNNIYVVWWSNSTGGTDEVMFRASNDGGMTFVNKTNLSNNTITDSVDTEIAANDRNVVVTWWERNTTSNEPVMRISNDNGQTFGPVLKLATNGTIGEST